MEVAGTPTKYLMRDEVFATWIGISVLLATLGPGLSSFGDEKLGFLYIVVALILQTWALFSWWVDGTYANPVLLAILIILMFLYTYSVHFLRFHGIPKTA